MPHMNGAQALLDDAATQLPLPLHEGAGVSVVPLQTAFPHVTPFAACVQAPAPLQVPVLPQVVVTVHRAWGSLAPLATLAHVPGLPVRLQAMQGPQLALPQQTPSTQFPELHSLAVVQLSPFPFLDTQVPPVPVQ